MPHSLGTARLSEWLLSWPDHEIAAEEPRGGSSGLERCDRCGLITAVREGTAPDLR